MKNVIYHLSSTEPWNKNVTNGVHISYLKYVFRRRSWHFEAGISGSGLQWNNFYKPVSVDENFTMADVFLMMVVDIVFYGIIVWYFDNTMPGDYGIPKPWYFPFTVSHVGFPQSSKLKWRGRWLCARLRHSVCTRNGNTKISHKLIDMVI